MLKRNVALAVLAAFLGAFGFSSVALAQDAGEDVDAPVEFPDFSSDLEVLSGADNSAAAVFIEADTVSAAAAFGENAAAALATEDGAAALGTDSDSGEIEIEGESIEVDEADELEVSVEFFEFEEADDDDDDDDDDDLGDIEG